MIQDKSPISLEKAANFLNNIKDVPFPHLLAGSGIAVIIADTTFSEITGKSSGLSGIGILLVVFGLAAYQNKRTKTSKKRKR
ncbi:MAG: hypothetical protein WAW23_13320 [Candidatus Methanoperedens sp.]